MFSIKKEQKDTNEVKSNVEERIKRTKSVSDCNIRDDYDCYVYMQTKDYFVANKIEIKGNQVNFDYNTKGLVNLDNLKMDELDKLRILIDVAKFEDKNNEVNINLDPSNIYVDYNFHGFLLEHFTSNKKTDFLSKYKALCGYLYLNQYSYEDIYKGGLSLMDGKEFLTQIKDATSANDVVSILAKRFDAIKAKSGEVVELSANTYKRNKIIAIVLAVVLVLSLGFNVYNKFFVISKIQTEQNATSFFLQDKYADTIKELDGIKTGDLNDDCLYILAVSYIQTSSLSEKSKSNALSQVSANGNSDYSYYWVDLGRGDFEDAYDIADNFDDERLKYYGYSVELNSLKTNTDLSSEEKEKRKTDLEKKLDTYLNSLKEEDK